MAKYKCSKCEATGESKCVQQRNMFTENQMVAMLRSLISIDFKDSNRGQGLSDIVVDYTTAASTKEAALEQLLRTLQRLTEQERKELTCSHTWIPLSPCMFGCCKPAE